MIDDGDPKTHALIAEKLFALGAEAMRSKCVAAIMMSGPHNIPLATKLLQLSVPKFELPERVEVVAAADFKESHT